MPRMHFALGASLALAAASRSLATDYVGPGGPIPDEDDGIPGVLESVVFVSDQFAVDESLMVTLTGLSHTWIGDLTATLLHVETGTSEVIFFRVGALVPTGAGDSSNLGGNYAFNDAFTGNLWMAALGGGTNFIIPGGDYAATGPLSSAPIALSAPFQGQSAFGTWRLTITDESSFDVGFLASWTLSLGGRGSAACESADHDCVTLGGPGCTNAGCCAAVCSATPSCCEAQWDFVCILNAQSFCGLFVPCPASDHNCATPGGPGCTDLACCNAVCASYAGCCVIHWDEYCISLADAFCVLPPPECPPSDHSCVTEGSAGCTDAACCSAVCDIFPPCCTVAWDLVCVSQVYATCGYPPTCFSSNHSCFQFGLPGCTDTECCIAVCEIDPPCCQFDWDQGCIDLAFAGCNGGGGPPDPGQPFELHETPADWMEDPVRWIRDMEPLDTMAPLNKIDFLIDGSNDALFDIVVNFRRCPAPQDIALLLAAAPNATIQQVGRYITYVALRNVPKSAMPAIVANTWVAFVERQVAFAPTLDTGVRTVKVRSSSTYSPNTVEDTLPWLTGTGVNIVIMDTGVDNTLHQAFAATPFIGGYNAITGQFGDPDDDFGHGTHVASIALGQSFVPAPFVPGAGRGVAPGAGLIDVKMIDATGNGTWVQGADAVEKVYDKRLAWSVDVVNMSFRYFAPSDGKDAFCQLVNLAEAMGICMVAAAGNEGPGNTYLGAPGAATRCITVAADDDNGTVFRGDDSIAWFSSQGPRADDNNGSSLDELKPEVAAPGVEIVAALSDSTSGGTAKSGTSMAAPHVAGIAALIRQNVPDINCPSLRCRIIDTATQLALNSPSLPAIDAVWNKASGWGLVDGHAAINVPLSFDVRFPGWPSTPAWVSSDLTTNPFPPQVGQQTVVSAQILNPASMPLPNVLVEFGVHEYAAATPTFFNIGTKRVTLSPGLNTVTMNWTPQSAGHRCLKVEIGYCFDTFYPNNSAQRNITVTMSPVTFEVRNSMTLDPQLIEFDVSIADPGWTVSLTPQVVVLSSMDCPVDVVALPHPPLEAPAGASTTIDIKARIGTIQLDGVTILAIKEDCNGNGEDDYFDVLNGTSVDADGDGNPDECDVTCPADLNHDGAVDGADLGIVLSGWGGGGVSDLDGNGTTDGGDLGLTLAAWGACG